MGPFAWTNHLNKSPRKTEELLLRVWACGSAEVWEIMTLILSKTDGLINSREILTGSTAPQSKCTEKLTAKVLSDIWRTVKVTDDAHEWWMMTGGPPDANWIHITWHIQPYSGLLATKRRITSLTERPPATPRYHLRRDLNIFRPLCWFLIKQLWKRFSIHSLWVYFIL